MRYVSPTNIKEGKVDAGRQAIKKCVSDKTREQLVIVGLDILLSTLVYHINVLARLPKFEEKNLDQCLVNIFDQ